MAANEDMDTFESWEEMEDSGKLDKKLEKIKPKVSPPEEAITQNSTVVAGVILQGEDSLRSQYVSPEPQVKILKRPPKTINRIEGPQVNGDSKPRQPIKTLQQREQEYAQARLRILGEARSPEEQLNDEKINKIQTKMEVLKTSDSDNILRLPKGPDGTKGFNLRR